MSDYEIKKRKAIKNLKLYLIFCTAFSVMNLIIIYFIDGYSFPRNFFSIWPIIGWGVPTAAKFIELGRYKEK